MEHLKYVLSNIYSYLGEGYHSINDVIDSSELSEEQIQELDKIKDILADLEVRIQDVID